MRVFDWLSGGGSLRASTLRQVWDKQYPLSFREEVGCGLEKVSDPISLIRSFVMGSRGFVHPLIGIMIIHLLGLSANKLSELITEQRNSSGDETLNYYCVNLVCPDVNTARWIIEEVSKHDVKRKMVTCSRCGMVYTQDSLLLRAPHIIERGDLWRLKLKELIKLESYSLRRIARELGVDPVTVKRFVAKCCISTSLKEHENKGSIKSKNHQFVEFKRQLWKELAVENKDATRTDLRHLNPGLWVWLKRNDGSWLEANLPAKKQDYKGSKRIDRGVQDKQLSLALGKEAKRILSEKGKAIQVTHTELARRLGMTDLFRKKIIGYFPKTMKLAEELTETREQFAKRRVKRSGEQFLQEGKIPKRWELVRRAGLRPDMEAKCEKLIDQVLENLK